jgi:hypothetical protein
MKTMPPRGSSEIVAIAAGAGLVLAIAASLAAEWSEAPTSISLAEFRAAVANGSVILSRQTAAKGTLIAENDFGNTFNQQFGNSPTS